MTILICYDGSASAKRALETAGTALGSSHAVLLHVWNPPQAFLPDAFSDPGVEADPSTDKMEQLAIGYAENVLDEGRTLAESHGLNAETWLARNDSSIWRTILDTADTIDAGVIVVGTRGRTAVQSALLGSVSGAVIHHAQRPVLVVPASER